MGLEGKTAWVTGGGTGIGAAGARALVAAGARVVVSGRRAAPLEALAAEIGAEAMALDVGDAAAVEAAVEAMGGVDILVASAGLNVANRALKDLDADGWRKVVDVNLNGVFFAAQSVMPGMRARGGGVVMLVSSWAGRYATRLTGAAYNATKHGVVALSESINIEEGGNGIRSTVIMPGEVATDILKSRPSPPPEAEMARMLQPEDLGAVIGFVAQMPARACVNEILISPTWNRFYQGFDEL